MARSAQELSVLEPFVSSAACRKIKENIIMGNLQILPSSFFSRERAAGYDPERLKKAKVLIVGMGAAGTNLLQTLSLSGVGNICAVDPDHIEPSNLTRSPLFLKERLQGKRRRMKAREAGIGLRSLGLPSLPRYRFATSYIESLGLGALAQMDVVAGCVDSNEVRALLSDWTRVLAKPFIEIGFRGEWLNVSVFQNAASDEPCWRCSNPQVFHGAASCSLYASQAVSSGLVPAIQATASVSGSVAAEAIVQALHGSFPLGNMRFHLNIRTGASDRVGLVRDPECPGAHQIWPEPISLSISSKDSIGVLLKVLAEYLPDPTIALPFPYIYKLPCEKCGTPIQVRRPGWRIKHAPKCKLCPDNAPSNLSGPIILSRIGCNDLARDALCYQVGLGEATIFSASAAKTHETRIFRMAGNADDLFQELPAQIVQKADPKSLQ
jgi:molybdopterin/thiamine biosynthesis adenylyltransferase